MGQAKVKYKLVNATNNHGKQFTATLPNGSDT